MGKWLNIVYFPKSEIELSYYQWNEILIYYWDTMRNFILNLLVYSFNKYLIARNSLAVQCLGLHAFSWTAKRKIWLPAVC